MRAGFLFFRWHQIDLRNCSLFLVRRRDCSGGSVQPGWLSGATTGGCFVPLPLSKLNWLDVGRAVFFESKLRGDVAKLLEFFYVPNDCSPVNAEFSGNRCVGWETVPGFLIQMAFDRAVDCIAVDANLSAMLSMMLFSMRVCGVCFSGCDRCHAVGSPLAWRAAACILCPGFGSPFSGTPQSIRFGRSICSEAFLFSHQFV